MNDLRLPVFAWFAVLTGLGWADPSLTGATSSSQSLFVRGSSATMTLEAKGLRPNETRPLSIVLRDAYGETVGEIANDGITADAAGNWSKTFPLATDFLGFRRVCVASGDLTLPKLGSRPAGCLTYGVFADWNERPKLAEEECFFGLQGGDYTKWVGAHWLYSASNPQTDPAASVAYQQGLLSREFPVYGTISCEYRFVQPFMTGEQRAYFDARAPYAPRMPFSIPANDPTGERHMRESLTAYAAAARASRPGRRVYEFALECDINSPDPETTVRSFKVAYEAIHAADPEALVFAAGVSNTSKLGYMKQLFDLGLASYMDGFNIHPYTSYPPERYGFIDRIREFVRLVRERKGDVPMISTEQGFAAPYAEEVKQMEGNVRVALILLGEGFSMHCAFWGYDFGNDHDDWFDGDYGMNYNHDLMTRQFNPTSTSPRPVLPALSAACLFLDGKRAVTSIEGLGDGVLGYAYADRRNACALALWEYADLPRAVTLDVGRATIGVADTMGNVTERTTEDGKLTLTVTGSPQYVLDPDPTLWGTNGTMKALFEEERERRRREEEARHPVVIRTVRPTFAGETPGVRVELENRTSSNRVATVSVRIPGVPEARKSARADVSASGSVLTDLVFGGTADLDPSAWQDVQVVAEVEGAGRETLSESVNFLRASSSGRPVQRFRWPAEAGDPEVWMSVGWTAERLSVDLEVHDDAFVARSAADASGSGDFVRLGLARTALAETTGNFQTDMEEEAKSELVIALTDAGPRVYRTAAFAPDRFPCSSSGAGVPADEMPRTVEVTTTGGEVVCRYHVEIPWTCLNLRSPEAGTVFRLAAQVGDCDAPGGAVRTLNWFEVLGTTPKRFAHVTLDGRPAVSEPAPRIAVREIGQSQAVATTPVGWTSCSWCVADAEHNVYLPGGWRIPCGSTVAEKCIDEVYGDETEKTLYSDGCGGIWSWDKRSGAFREVVVTADGLTSGRTVFSTATWQSYTFFVAPPGLTKGFAAQAKFGALVRYRSEIRGYDANGNDLGVIFDCAAHGIDAPYCAAFHPTTGDLLVGNEWPDRHVHRFTADGQEVTTGVWPYNSYALTINSVGGSDLFFASGGAERASESFDAATKLVFGVCATETCGFADGGDGWWLATTQGAQYYRKDDPSYCACRIGGIARADRIGISDNKVLVAAGDQLYAFHLDALPDETPCSTERDKVSEATMPADLPTTSGNWAVGYDADRRAVVVADRRLTDADTAVFGGTLTASGGSLYYRKVIEVKWNVGNINGAPALYGYETLTQPHCWGLLEFNADQDYIIKGASYNLAACAPAGETRTFPGNLTLGETDATDYHYPASSSYWRSDISHGWLVPGGGTVRFGKGLVFANGGIGCLDGKITSESVFSVADAITVTAPASNPFQLYSSDGNYNARLRFDAAFVGEPGTMVDSFVYSGRGAATYTFAGDMSAYRGELWAKRNVTFAFTGAAQSLPGKVRIGAGGILAVPRDGVASLSIGTLQADDGARIELAVDGGGTRALAVTDALILPDEGTLPIVLTAVSTGTDAEGTLQLTLPEGAPLDRLDISMVSGGETVPPTLWKRTLTTDGAGRSVLTVTVCKTAFHTAAGDGYYDASVDASVSHWEPQLSAFEPDRVYIDATSGSINSSRSGATVFGGRRLVLKPSSTWGIVLNVNNDLTVGDLVFEGNMVVIAYSNTAVTRTLRGALTLAGGTSSHVLGASGGLVRLYSTLCGTGTIALGTRLCSQTSSANGTYELYGTNTAFSGRLILKNNYENNGVGTTDVRVWDARALGGAIAGSGAYAGVTFMQGARLVAMASLDCTETSRGFFVSGNGAIDVANAADTVTLHAPLTMDGVLEKDGAGTLALAGPVRFTSAQLETPTAGGNVLNVKNGWLAARAADAVKGLAIAFSAGTGVRLSAPERATGDEKDVGFNLASCASVDLSACGGKLNVSFEPSASLEGGDHVRLTVCTVRTGTIRAEDLVFDVPEGAAPLRVRTRTKGEMTTYVAEFGKGGMAVLLR